MASDVLSQQPDFLTPGEAASALRVSEKTVMRLLWKGSLRGLKIGGQWRINRDDYNQYVRNAYPQPLTPTPPEASQ